MSGQFMRGASGNPAPGSGQSAVSWMPSPVRQGGPGASQAVPGGQMQQPGARGGLRVPVQVKRCSNQAPWAAPVRLANQMAPWRCTRCYECAGQPMRGPDGVNAPGQGAVSWTNADQGQGGPGSPGQSMAPSGAQGVPGAPGQGAVSWMVKDLARSRAPIPMRRMKMMI